MPGGLGLALAGYLVSLVAQATPSIGVAPGERVEVVSDGLTVRGRVADVTADAIVVWDRGARLNLPLFGVRRIDRLGDSLFNGAAIGAGIGASSAALGMAQACHNSGCADTLGSIDPRWVFVGSLLGAGIGILVDRTREGRRTVYPAPPGSTPRPSTVSPGDHRGLVAFGHVGWARLTDD